MNLIAAMLLFFLPGLLYYKACIYYEINPTFKLPFCNVELKKKYLAISFSILGVLLAIFMASMQFYFFSWAQGFVSN